MPQDRTAHARRSSRYKRTAKRYRMYSKFNDEPPYESDTFWSEGSGQVSLPRTLTNICRWQTFTLRQSET